MVGSKLVVRITKTWVARSSMKGMNHSAITCNQQAAVISVCIHAYVRACLTSKLNRICSANANGPKYDIKYPSVIQCKNACKNDVAGCDAINYSKYVVG